LTPPATDRKPPNKADKSEKKHPLSLNWGVMKREPEVE